LACAGSGSLASDLGVRVAPRTCARSAVLNLPLRTLFLPRKKPLRREKALVRCAAACVWRALSAQRTRASRPARAVFV